MKPIRILIHFLIIFVSQVFARSCEEGVVRPRDDHGCNFDICSHGGWLMTLHDCITDGSPRYLNMTSFRGSKYALSLEEKWWEYGRKFCQEQLNGDLAVFETSAEWQHVFEEKKRLDPKREHWLGGSAKESGSSGEWKWVTNETLYARCYSGPRHELTGGCGASNFKSSYPNEPRPTCLRSETIGQYNIMDFDLNWTDSDCTFRERFICEYRDDDDDDNDDDV